MASIFGTINMETSSTWRHHDQFYPNNCDRDRPKSRQKYVFSMPDYLDRTLCERRQFGEMETIDLTFFTSLEF